MHDPNTRTAYHCLSASGFPARRVTGLTALACCLALAGCAETPFVRSSLPIEKRDKTPTTVISEQMREKRSTGFYQTPPPVAEKNAAGNAPPPTSLRKGGGEKGVTLNLQSMPLPEFVNAVFGAVLKLNVSVDPQVAQRTDMVSLRSGAPMNEDQIFAAAQAVLRSYGVAAQEFNGLVRVVPESSQSGYLPEIRRGRAMPDVPESLRPVFFLTELEHTQSTQAMTWLRSLFGSRLTATEDARRNMILLSGQSDTIRTALEAIQLLDQPQMRGRYSVRIAPVFWSAEEMARRLVDLLTAEGYAASMLPSSSSPVLVVPVGPINSVVVFAANENVLNHVLRWAQELDQTPPSRSGGYITYHVRNVDAADLAATLSQVMGESSPTTAATAPTPAPTATAPGGASAAAAAATPARQGTTGGGSRVVVNKSANSIIIRTTPSEYQQWYGLLQELDRPARAALVMATVAEVRLNKSDVFGFNWMLSQFRMHGYNVNTGTAMPPATGSTIGAGTLRFALATLNGDPRALLHALSTQDRIKVLSNPSVMARNGETATIQVGTDVPILSSQISTPVANTGTVDTTTSLASLQTVQYRQTGVMLRVKPVIHAGGRIEIDVAQEVSLVQPTTSESGSQTPTQSLTPPILSRKIDTKISVADGNTIVLGGLMQEYLSDANAGIPFLKDIPYLGAIFRTRMANSVDRTELVVLLTPYVVEDDFDANAITDTFRNQFSWAQEIKPGDLSGKNALSNSLADYDSQPPAPVERRVAPPGAAHEGMRETAENVGASMQGATNSVGDGTGRRFSGGFGVPDTPHDAAMRNDGVMSVTGENASAESYRSRPYVMPDPASARENTQRKTQKTQASVAREQQPTKFVPPSDLPAATNAARPAADSRPAQNRPTGATQNRPTATPAAAPQTKAAQGQQPAGGDAERKPVTDEALKKELLEVLRNSGRAPGQ